MRRTLAGRLVRGLGALVLLAVVAVGVPWLLLIVGRWPDPRGWTVDGFLRLWTTPDTGTVLLNLITLVAGVAWVVLMVSVVTELINLLVSLASRRRFRLRVPGLGGPQALAAVLILAVATMIIAPLSAGVGGLPTGPPHPVTEPATPNVPRVDSSTAPGPGSVTDRSGRSDRSDHGPGQVSTSGVAPTDRATGSAHSIRDRNRIDSMIYTVKTGDDLWSLAERFYGDGGQWRRIAEANANRLTGGPDELVVGWRLTLPGITPPDSNPATEPSGGVHRVEVRSGDTLTSLAEHHYGDPAAWRTIYDANRSIITDPDQIEVGWTLALPRIDQPDAPAKADDRRARTPAASEPAPSEPAPSEPAPSQPAPSEPAPSEPAPTQPAPTQPSTEVPTEPTRTTEPAAPVPATHLDVHGVAEAQTALASRLVAVGAVGGLLAASLVAGLLARREWQLMNRPVGRRIPHPAPAGQQLETALGRRSEPLTLTSLDLALRAIARHCQSAQVAVPDIQLVLAGEEQIDFRIAGDLPPTPVGFAVTPTGWVLDRDSSDYLGSIPGVATAPQLWPALISVGRTPRGSYVLVNLESAGLLALRPPTDAGTSGLGVFGASRTDDDQITAVLTAVAMELSFSYWSGDLRVTAVGDPGEPAPDWLDAIASHTVTWSTDRDQVIERARVRATAQRSLEPAQPLGQRRLDLATGDAWTPELMIFTRPLPASTTATLETLLLGGSPVSLAAVIVDAPGPSGPPPRRAQTVGGDWTLALGRGDEPAWLDPAGIELLPQRVELEIRTSLVELVSTTGREDTVAAPWWNDPDHPVPSTWSSPSPAPGPGPVSSAPMSSAPVSSGRVSSGRASHASGSPPRDSGPARDGGPGPARDGDPASDGGSADESLAGEAPAVATSPSSPVDTGTSTGAEANSDQTIVSAPGAGWSRSPVSPHALPSLPPAATPPPAPLPGAAPGSVTFMGSRLTPPVQPAVSGPAEESPVIPSAPRATAEDRAPAHPTVRLLGPIDLIGAVGVPPSRATRQCVEYCVWLLEHPGATAVAMADALCVAEGTRRSNMSRLRSWLGEATSGQPYLPEAYSGRIFLDPMVTSDWHRLRLLVGSGVNRAGTAALVGALELVRGAPLADAAPGQWYWAEELRTDMVSVVRDIGAQLARTALAEKDIDLARWAAARALAAAPGDEVLMCERIRTEHRAGNPAEVERLVLQVQGRARSLGVDLGDDTVDLMQRVLEGGLRAREA